jgi:hypothetical protein
MGCYFSFAYQLRWVVGGVVLWFSRRCLGLGVMVGKQRWSVEPPTCSGAFGIAAVNWKPLKLLHTRTFEARRVLLAARLALMRINGSCFHA